MGLTDMQKMQASKFEVSLFHLEGIHGFVKGHMDSLKFLNEICDIKSREAIKIVGGLIFLIILHCESYREEFEICRKEFYKDGKLNMLQGIKEVEKDIRNKWPDLWNFRSQVIAHNFRNLQGESVFMNQGMKKYKIPITIEDIIELGSTSLAIHKHIRNEYPSVFEKYQSTEHNFFEII